MTWIKGPSLSKKIAGIIYYSASCIVWRREKAPLCKYIIRRIIIKKRICWMLYQWNNTISQYVVFPEILTRLRHAQDRADWLEREEARAEIMPDHFSPIEAAAEEFAVCVKQEVAS